MGNTKAHRRVRSRSETCAVYIAAKSLALKRANKKSWEHIINDIRITTLSNIALCCVGCNASKGNKDLATWLHSENAQKEASPLRQLQMSSK